MSAHGCARREATRKKGDQDRISGNVANWAGGKVGRMEATPNVIRDNTKKTEARGTPRREFVWRESAKK